jgi:hypothetical protein
MQLVEVDPVARFRSEVLRTADRLRGLGAPGLALPGHAGVSIATAAHIIGEAIVNQTAALTGTAAPVLPRLADYAAGDQLAVIGSELADLAEEFGADTAAAEALSEISAQLVGLRRAT